MTVMSPCLKIELSHSLLVFFDYTGVSYLNSIERFDPHTNQWSGDVAPTSSCRTSVGVAVLDNFLYAVGGQDGVSNLSNSFLQY